jgi:FkbM family methyltransferase
MNKIVIVGCSVLGRHILDGLRKQGITPLAFAIDNPIISFVDDLPVVSIGYAISEYSDALFIVSLFQGSKMLDRLRMADVNAVPFANYARAHPDGLLPFAALDVENTLPYDGMKLFSDMESVNEYLGQVNWRTSLDRKVLPPFHDIQEIYFPEDLFTLSDDDVLLDCGAYDGDTVSLFRKHSNGRVIAIEPDPQNFDELKSNHPDVIAYNCAVGAIRQQLTFNAGHGASSSFGGSSLVECVTIDELLHGQKVTFIKMDIEGAELDALKGASETIVLQLPILAICLYHKPDDILEIPQYILSLSDKYNLYLRRYAEDCWEEILYALPRVSGG